MTHEILRWEDPAPARTTPPRGSKDDGWVQVAAQLQLSPGRWAVIHESEKSGAAAGLANQVRNGGRVGFQPAGTFEAVMRTLGPNRYAVYARAMELDEEDW